MTAISADGVLDLYELSPFQQGLLFHALHSPDSHAYRVQTTCTLDGRLNVAAFEQAWQCVVDRHAVLRTSFHYEDLERPLQVVHRHAKLELLFEDWRALSHLEQDAKLEAWLAADQAAGFDLGHAPLIRVSLFRLAEDRHQLTWLVHHLILDGWSLPRIFSEVFAAYESFRQGMAPDLPERRPYRDFIGWLRRQDRAPAEAFWRQTLAGFDTPTPLWEDMGPASGAGEGFEAEERRLPAGLSQVVQSFARQHRLTLNSVFQGAWVLLLSRLSREPEIVFGATVSGRPAGLTGVEEMVGPFINSIPVRARVDPDQALILWLQELQRRHLRALQFQHASLADIQRWSAVPSPRSLFDSLVVFENYPLIDALSGSIGGLRVTGLRSTEPTHYPLTAIIRGGPEVSVTLLFRSDHFKRETIGRLVEYLRRLLEGMVADPDRPVGQLCLLSEAERQHVLVEWNDTARGYDLSRCLPQLVEDQVERTPEAVAVVFGVEQLTYRELNQQANRLAHRLRQLGVGPDGLVGVCLDRSPELVVALLGILKAGAAYLPLDPSYPRERLAFMLQDGQPAVLLTHAAGPALTAAGPEAGGPAVVCLDRADLSGLPDGNPAPLAGPDNLAYVIYTSGSTGRPKGAMNTHRGIGNRLLWMQEAYQLGPEEAVLQKTPISFDVSVWELFWPLLAGARLVLAAPGGQQDPGYLRQLIVEEGITTLHFVPSMLYAFLEQPGLEACRTLRRVICSGEALPLDLQQRFFARLPEVQLHNLYGPTEAAIDVTAWACQADGPLPCVPIGRPIANTRLYVLDGHLQPVPVGVPGELFIGGVGVARGYLNRPELTAERFLPDPFWGEGQLYRTGDLVRYLGGGALQFLGRLDQQVKVRGVRIELGELEAVLRQHSQVAEAAAVARQAGPGDTRLAAYVVAAGSPPGVEELRAYLGERLPEAMLPGAYVFLDALPLTPNGKLDRAALPAPGEERPELQTAFAPPRTPAERLVARLMAEVLHVEQVGIHDSFFDLGGHSLLAVQLLSRLRAELSIELSLRDIFDGPTVAALAAKTQQAGAAGGDGIPRRAADLDVVPPSPGQQRLWFLDRLEGGSAAYVLPIALRLRGPIDADVLQRSLNEIVRRHEALRTTFSIRDGEPVQIIAPSLALDLQEVDLRGRKTEVRRLLSQEAQRPFDLERGPLLRAMLLRLAQEDAVLLVTLHHVVTDGWSMAVLLRELTCLYTAFAAGQPSPLPELPIQYADFGLWQRRQLVSGALDESLRYWKQQLANAPALQLPTDHARPSRKTFRGATLPISIDRRVADGLRALGHSEGASLFMTLLAAFQALLSRETGQEDVAVGSMSAGRLRPETEPLIGFFVNSLVLRTDLSGEPGFRELLRRVREVALDAFAHQQAPFERVVEEVSVERDLGRNPLFQATFGLNAGGQPVPLLELPGLSVEPIPLDHLTAKFDLHLELAETDQVLEGALEYDTDLFEAATIERLAGHLHRLLEGIMAEPDRPVAQLALLGEAERQQVLVEWNDTDVDEPNLQRCVHELIQDQVARTPDAVAVMFEGQTLSYGQLNRRANQLAHELQARGAGPDSVVGLCVERSAEMVVGLLGILKAGAAFLPLDPSYPAERLAFMIEDAKVRVLVTQEGLLPEAEQQAICLDRDRARIAERGSEQPSSDVRPSHLAYVIYTSGSMGKPKGVMIEHGGGVNVLLAMRRRLAVTEADTLLAVTTLSFDMGVLEILLHLISGARLAIATRETVRDSQQLREAVGTSGATILQATPVTWRGLIDAGWRGENVCIVCGGEAMSPDLAAQLAERGREAWNAYGPTEASVYAAAHRLDSAPYEIVPIGRPLDNAQIFILDGSRQPVPAGVPGEIFIGGRGVARGYLNQPELTEERFVPSPFGESRLYRTGDLARYRSDGVIEYLGRIDEQVKIRGFRIEPGEVEAVLRQHETVAEAVVVAREDQPGDKQLVAYVTAAPDASLSAPELRRLAGRQLPAYMVPVTFVFLDRLPLTPSGKVDRKALPAPAGGRPELTAAFVPPRTEIERQLADILADTLRLDRVGVHDNFFELGASSLTLVRVHARLLEALQRDLPLVDLFQYPTVGALAAHLGAGSPASLMPVQRSGTTRPKRTAEHEPIAIIGLSGRFPGAQTIAEFWESLRNGKESISFFTDEELRAAGVPASLLEDKGYVRARGMLDQAEWFDAGFFGFSPREADILDPQQRLFLECAWEALESAGYDPLGCERSIGVYGGVSASGYALQVYGNRSVAESVGGYQILNANNKDHVTTRVAYKLNLKGPAFTIQTACSTSLVAVGVACQSLIDRQCEMALAGGASLATLRKTGYIYEQGAIFSPDGHCRAFDAEAQGTVDGSGVGVVLLKRLSDAVADGDYIHAVIKGWAVNNDGSAKVGYTAPSVEGQAQVVAAAQAMAEVPADSISYVEAHGTGTALGDPIEVSALTQAFRASTDRAGFCALGSVKTNIGHLDTAAGIAGLIKTVLSLEHGELPASLHFNRPNPHIEFDDSPFYVNTRLSPWPAGETPRRAGVSSFGLGGTNAHLVLEEAPPVEVSSGPGSEQLLVLSARTESALDEVTTRLAAHLKSHPDLELADVAYTLQAGRTAFEYRRILSAESVADAAASLEALDRKRVLTGRHTTGERPIAFMFPGGGAQYANMTRGLYDAESTFRQHIDRCTELLEPYLGIDLRQALYPEPAEEERAGQELEESWLAQPALFATEYALAQLWMERGIEPQAMIGHSTGEYVAACLAGVFSLEDGLRVIARRGRLMQDCERGAMLAVSLAPDELHPLLDQCLSIAAVNAPEVCVVSGPPPSIVALEGQLAAREVECRRLHFSHAAHCQLVEPAMRQLAEELRTVKLAPPRVAYVSNVSGTWITPGQAMDPEYWAEHLRRTVRFADGLHELLNDPRRVLLEVGPGQTLTRLARQHPALGADHVVLSSLRPARDSQPEVRFWLTTLGRLWLAGQPIDWRRLHASQRRRRTPLPTYPFQRQRHWVEPDEQALAATAATAGLHKRQDVADWFFIPSWRRSLPPEPIPDGDRERWLIFVEGSPLAMALGDKLSMLGHDVSVVHVNDRYYRLNNHVYGIRPGSREDYALLLRQLHDYGRMPTRIVHMWALETPDQMAKPEERLARAQELGFYSLLSLAQALGDIPGAGPLPILMLTNQAQVVAGERDLYPEKASALGVCKVIPQEYPTLACRSIDVVPPGPGEPVDRRLVDAVFAEVTGNSAETVVAYRNAERWVQTFEPVRADAREPRVRPGGAYLITGGLGRIGLTLARHLAETPGVKLALLGRTGVTDRDDRELVSERLAEIEALGAEVSLLQADAGDAVQLRQAVQRAVKRFGTLNGVVHAAGVLDLQTIDATDRALCERHLKAKVSGLLALDQALHGLELDFCLLCSSVSTVLGGLGHAAYSAANCFMDAFALERRRAGAERWTSVDWEAWDFGQQHAAGSTLAEFLMRPEEGVEAFRRILSMPAVGQVLVSSGDLQQRMRQWLMREPARESESDEAALAGAHQRPHLGTAFVAPRNDVEQRVAKVWQELLGVEQVGVHDDFFELGGHSLLAVRLLQRIDKEFDSSLSISSLIEEATVEHQACLLADHIGTALPARSSVVEEEISCVRPVRPFGSNPPLFMWIDSTDGTVLHFRHFVRHLGDDQRIYGLEWRQGIWGAQQDISLQDCAAIFVRDIRAAQPEGPYFLAGHSFGGVLVFEIALQLEAQGQQVAFVGLLDTLGPTDPINGMQVSLLERARYRWQTFELLGPRERLDYLVARLGDFRRRAWQKARRIEPPPCSLEFNWVRTTFRMMGGPTTDIGTYVPGIFGGRLTYFLSSASTEPHEYDWRAGWHRHAKQGMTVIKVPGDHASMLLEPAIDVVAKKLAVELRNAQAASRIATNGSRANDTIGQERSVVRR